MEGCHTVIKYLMVIFNFIFFVLGIAILGVGIYARIKEGDFNDYFLVINETNSTWENFGSLCIAVGVFVMILGGSGCYGAAKENRGCLGFFATLVFLVFVLECVAAGLGYHYRNTIEDGLQTNMNKTLVEEVFVRNKTEYKEAWKTVQGQLGCCGVDNATIYDTYGKDPTRYGCKTVHLTIGCYSKVKDELTGKWGAWAGAAIGIGLVQLLAIIFSCLLIREIGKDGSYTVV